MFDIKKTFKKGIVELISLVISAAIGYFLSKPELAEKNILEIFNKILLENVPVLSTITLGTLAVIVKNWWKNKGKKNLLKVFEKKKK